MLFLDLNARIEFFQSLEPQKHIFAAAGMVCYQSSENQDNDPGVIAQPASSDFVCRSSDIALFDDGENYTARVDVLAVFTTSLPRALKKITLLEFLHYDHQECGSILARDFVLSMVAAAYVICVNQYLDRVDDLSKDPSLSNIHNTCEAFENFVEVGKKLQPLSLAISSYGEVCGTLSKSDFRRAAFDVVCDVDVTDNMVQDFYCG